MSSNKVINPIEYPVGLDKVIANINDALAEIPWTDKVYGRAIRIKSDIRSSTLCVVNNGNYFQPFPTDDAKCVSLILPTSPETDIENNNGSQIGGKRTLEIYFWVNYSKLNPSKTYLFSEELRNDVLMALYEVNNLDVKSFVDQDVESVLNGYALNDLTKFKYPHGVFKFVVEVSIDTCGN